MGFDDFSQTNLVLGLGLPSSPAHHHPIKNPSDANHSSEPSLTLCLPGDSLDHNRSLKKLPEPDCHRNINTLIASNDHQSELYGQQDSAASSFSNVSVKRERDSDEVAGIDCRRVSDEDDDGSNCRKKLRLTKAQSALLEECFKQHSTLNPKQKQDLARELKLRPRQVEVWFQNRRARTKLKQTELDCEYLKKCCETLTDENRRLQRELQELRAVKLAPPLYMQLPAATLSMCPSCEKIGSDVGAPAKSPFTKPHFYNPFPNPSAAC